MWGEDGELSVEAVDGTVNQGFAKKEGGVVGEEAGGKVIGSIDDDVVALYDGHGIVWIEAKGVEIERDVWVCIVDTRSGGIEFGFSDVEIRVKDLALEV